MLPCRVSKQAFRKQPDSVPVKRARIMDDIGLEVSHDRNRPQNLLPEFGAPRNVLARSANRWALPSMPPACRPDADVKTTLPASAAIPEVHEKDDAMDEPPTKSRRMAR